MTRRVGVANIHVDPPVLSNPCLSGKLFSLAGSAGYFIIPAEPDLSGLEIGEDGLPIPPTEALRLWYGGSPSDYVEGGRRNVAAMLTVLAEAGTSPASLTRVLDVGCGAGRMLRHLQPQRPGDERWGVDISAEHIAWGQQHLSPSLNFATTTTAPHLPFEDNYFDLIYCGSLFTHISDLADAWFLELRRVLRPGGHAYVTIHDERIVEWLVTEGRNDQWMATLAKMVCDLDAETSVLSQAYGCFAIEADARNQVQVFHNAAYLVKKWSPWMPFLSLTPNAYFRQTALLFRKR